MFINPSCSKVNSFNTQLPPTDNSFLGKKRNIVALSVMAGAIAMGLIAFVVEIGILIKERIEEKLHSMDPETLKTTIQKKFSVDFANKIQNIKNFDYIYLFKKMSLCHADEIKLIKQLDENFDIKPEQLKEIFMGAHIRLDDNGALYNKWSRELIKKNERYSSHHSDKQQYGIQGPFIKELLFSRTTDKNGRVHTWFQLENHPVSFGHIIRHMIDFFKYKITQQNQGPFGSSSYTEKDPIILKVKKFRNHTVHNEGH